MLLLIASVIAGLALLIWSAGMFITGAASLARHYSISPLLIGMVIIGFGTSAPELVVSAMAASDGKLGISLGNAYGSNIVNIALIIGLTALIRPIAVQSTVLRRELPVLLLVTALAAWQVMDLMFSRQDALVLLAVFLFLVCWVVWQGIKGRPDALGREVEQELRQIESSPGKSFLVLVAGLLILVASSRILVWAAVGIAGKLGISDLVVGLTVVAIGTSLPELASSLIASRRGEHDIALGNIVGSNMFNTLAVAGTAGVIMPMELGPELFSRDFLAMSILTLLLFVFAYGFRGPGRINRFEGGILLASYVVYNVFLLWSARPG